MTGCTSRNYSLDEFHRVYRDVDIKGLISELYCVVNYNGKRHLMFFLSGSRALIRSLVFLKIENVPQFVSELYKGFPGSALDLNKHKFVPVDFGPLATLTDMRSAWKCVSKTDADDEELIKLCYQSRGRIRLIVDNSCDEVKSSFFSDTIRRSVLEVIFRSYLKTHSVVDIGHVVSLISDDFNWTRVCSYETLQMELTASLLYQMADEGIIHFTGGHEIGFSHRGDILTVAKLFAQNHPSGILSDLEKLSMLAPNQSGVADINKGLVAESLAHSGFYADGFGNLKFKNVYTRPMNSGIERQADGTRRYSEQAFTNDEAKCFGRLSRWRLKQRAAQLRKEVPDEGGSDLVSVFEVDKDLRKDPVKWLVFRVQVEMGTSRDTYTKPSVVDFIRFGARVDEDFVRVLWTAQKTSIKHQPEQNVYVLDSSRMMKFWSPSIQKFVIEQKLDT
jgi:hypothetical protein